MKKIFSSLIVILGTAMAFLCLSKPMYAEAATKFKVTWDVGSNDWYVSDDDGKNWYSKDHVETHFAAGDIIVVDGVNASTGVLMLNIPAQIGEVAAAGNSTVNITAPGADTAYAVTGSTLIINGNVKKLIANHGAVNQVNGDVGTLQCDYKAGENIKVGVTGTVGSANVYLPSNLGSQVTVYNIAAGKLRFNTNDSLGTEPEYYSLTPTGNTGNADGTGNQLDSVPKTGMFPLSVVMFALSIISGTAGVIAAKKKSR